MPTCETLCTDLIAKARQPLTIPVNYDLFFKDVREHAKRVLTFDPGPIYDLLADKIKPFERVQSGRFSMDTLFPTQEPGYCACGCGEKLKGRRRRWATDYCNDFPLSIYWILYGKADTINFYMERIAGGDRICMGCGEELSKDTKNLYKGAYNIPHLLQVDHIVPVQCGGGGCWLSNYQRLCNECHTEKSKQDNELRRKLIKAALRSDRGPDLFTLI